MMAAQRRLGRTATMDGRSRQAHICTCGHFETLEEDGVTGGGLRQNGGMEASFVHLPSNVMTPPLAWTETTSHHASHEGFLETVRHASALLRAGQGKALPQESGDEGVSLCQDCIDRVARAIDLDTERLEEERRAYEYAVTVEKERLDNLESALRSSHWSAEASQYDSEELITRTEESFREEIAVLTAAVEKHEQELQDLQNVQAEQARLSRELDTIDDYLDDQRNILEIDANAFSHVQQQLSRTLRDTDREIEALSAVRLHAALFDLVVDKRGLRYPLINELRLAYRPKGDVHWTEISAAWSQAAQLMLLVAASVKFRSRDWRIVPLTTCAKLIHLDGKHRSVYTLGGSDAAKHPTKMAMSLRAILALLDQMCRHVVLLGHEGARPLPYETTRNRIGRFELSQLEENNDSGWSSVIHCMASNLEWLSERASDYEIQNVTVVV